MTVEWKLMRPLRALNAPIGKLSLGDELPPMRSRSLLDGTIGFLLATGNGFESRNFRTNLDEQWNGACKVGRFEDETRVLAWLHAVHTQGLGRLAAHHHESRSPGFLAMV